MECTRHLGQRRPNARARPKAPTAKGPKAPKRAQLSQARPEPGTPLVVVQIVVKERSYKPPKEVKKNR